MAGYAHNGSDTDFYVIEYPAADIPPVWTSVYNYDSGLDDRATALWLDANDDVYVVGDDATLTTGSDIHAAKLNGTSGAVVWSKSYNSTGGHNDMALDLVGDPNGELYVVGYKNDALGGTDDVLVMKVMKDNGNQLWLKEYDGVGYADRSLCACLIADGNLLVGGWSDRWTSDSNDYDFLALKFESGAINGPTPLVIVEITNNTEVPLSWSDNTANEDNYIIERKIGESGTYSVIATLPADTTSYVDTGLTPDTRYCYQVKAYSATLGSSPYSNEACAKTTFIDPAPPSLTFQYGAVTSGDDYAEAIAVGPDNHPVVTGFITGDGTSFDYYTIKLDRADLSEQWNASYNDGDNEVDVATAITVDSSNRVVVSGYSSLYAIGGSGNTNDMYTIGYPADGSTESWTDQYNGPDGNDDRTSAVASAIDGSDSTVVVGYGKNDLLNDDIYVIKYLSDGTFAWAITPYDGGEDDYPAAVAFDSNGDVLVGGYSHNGINKDFFVAKYNGADGSLVWQKQFDGAAMGDDIVNALAVDAAGDVYVTGSSANASGNSDIYTIKYAAANGNLLWEKSFNGAGDGYDVGEGIAFDPVDGNILVAGTTFVGTGNHDYQLIRYDAAGTVVWQKTDERPSSDEALYAMSIDGSGNVTLTGTTDIGANDDILTVKYDSEGIIFGASIYDGVANGDDAPSSLVTNSLGETFVAGYTSTASNDTDYIVFLTAGDAMQAPVPFVATQLYDQIALSWGDNSDNETGFEIERCFGSGADCDEDSEFGFLMSRPANTTGYSDLGLGTGSTYTYRIRSVNASGDSSRWVYDDATTENPAAPTPVSANAPTTSTVQLIWQDNTANEDYFTLERRTWLVDHWSSYELIDNEIPENSTSYIDYTACPGKTYSYRIKARIAIGWSTPYSDFVPDTVVPNPVAPGGFSVTRISEVQLKLTWTDNSNDETGFRIERCTGTGTACDEDSEFSHIGNALANFGFYDDTALEINTTYSYRVTPYKTMSCTELPVYTYTPIEAGTTTLIAPSGLSTSELLPTQVSFSWTDETATETGFRIYRCEGASCTPGTLLATLPADSTSYVDDTVCEGINYRYLVQAYKGADEWTIDSTILDVAVPEQEIPITFIATQTSEVTADLSWDMAGDAFDGFQIDRCEGDSCIPGTQIADIAADPSLLLSYSLDESVLNGTGAVKDNSGNDNHGTGSGLVTIAGQYNGAADISNNDYLNTPVNIDQSATSTGVTFELWAYPDTNNSYYKYAISTDGGSGAYDWSLLYRYGNWYIMNGSGIYATTIPATLYTWQHIVVTFDPANGVTLYRNGDEYTWNMAAISFDTSDANVTIGRRGTYSTSYVYNFQGRLDEVKVYDRVLSNAEALDRFNTGPVDYKSYTDAALSPGTTYGYQVKSYSNGNCQAVSDGTLPISYITTPVLPPPSTFVCTPSNSTQVDCIWTDNSVGETNFVIQRCTGPGCNNYDDLSFPAADETSESDTSVCAGQTYSYQIAAQITGQPNSSWVQELDVQPILPVTPADFAATALSEVQVQLTWSDTIDDESAYVLEKCVGDLTVCVNDTDFTAVSSGVSGLIDGNLVPGGTYTYRLRAYKTATCGWWTSWEPREVTTPQPPAPSDLVATPFNTTRIDLTWTDNTASETNMVVERCAGSGCTPTEFDILPENTTSYSDDTVSENTTYTYSVRARKLGVWDTDPSNTAESTTPAKQTPTALTVTVVSEIQVDLSWSDSNIDETGFKLERCLDSSCVLIDTTGANVTSSSDTSVLPDEPNYYYQVSAYKDATQSWESDPSAQAPADTTPVAPSDFFATPINTTQIDLSWTDNTVSETSFAVERCVGSGCIDFSPLTVLGPGITTYTDDSVSEGTTYNYRIRAEKSTAPKPWVTAWTMSGDVATPAKLAPTNLMVTWVSESQLDASWTDNSNDETGFHLDRCLDSSCTTVDFTHTLGADVVNYSDIGLAPGQTYCYQVRAYKTATSSWVTDYTSPPVCETTTPTAPSDLVATPINTTQIDLGWADNTVSETNMVVERCTGSLCSDFSEIAELGADVTSYSDIGVSEGITYNYRVAAKKTTVPSWQTSYSNEAEVATESISTFTPSNLAVTWVSEVQLDVTWTDNSNDETGFELDRCLDSACASVEDTFYLNADVTSYSDASLVHDTTYYYQVRAYKTAINSWMTDSTTPSAPEITVIQPPGGFTATPINTTRIDVSWTDNTATETAMILERCEGVDCSNYLEIQQLPAGSTSYSDIDVAENTTYNYRIKSVKTTVPIWGTAWIGPATATTPSKQTPPGVTVTRISEIELNVSWTDPNIDESGFQLDRCLDSACASVEDTFVLAADVTSYDDTPLLHETTYYYQVRAYKTANHSWVSDNTAPPIPGTTTLIGPDNLVATAVNTTRIDLSWTDNTVSETNMVVERCLGSGCLDFVLIDELGVNVTNYSDTSVAHTTTYSYRVKAKNGVVPWDSGYSNAAEATTITPQTPTSLTTTGVGDTQVNLNWSDTNIDESGFHIDFCTGSGCGGTDFAPLASVGANVTTYSHTGLQASTIYRYRVQAYKTATQGWTSDDSNIAEYQTLPATPGASLTALADGSRKIILNWSDVATDEDGYEVEIQLIHGGFWKIVDLPANTSMYVDYRSIDPETEYTYRVRSYRGSDVSNYSSVAVETTPTYTEGDGTCWP